MKRAFYFIRHGESESNAGLKTQHPRTIALTPTGRAQAESKAQGFSHRPDLIVTSRYIRTGQTAAPFMKKFAGVPVQEWNIHEFTYMSADKYKDTTNLERRPHIDAYWDRADPHHRDDATSESFADFAARCRDTVNRMKACDAPVTLAFSHGYMMRGVLFTLEGRFDEVTPQTMRDFWHTHLNSRIHNCAKFDFEILRDGVAFTGHDMIDETAPLLRTVND